MKAPRVEWRAVAQDEDSTPDTGRWTNARDEAEAHLAQLREGHVEPPWDDTWLERRTVGEPQRVSG